MTIIYDNIMFYIMIDMYKKKQDFLVHNCACSVLVVQGPEKKAEGQWTMPNPSKLSKENERGCALTADCMAVSLAQLNETKPI